MTFLHGSRAIVAGERYSLSTEEIQFPLNEIVRVAWLETIEAAARPSALRNTIERVTNDHIARINGALNAATIKHDFDPRRHTDFEKGERQALLEVRSFITKHGLKEVDAYCAQRLHDIRMDAFHQGKSRNSDLEQSE